MHCTYCDSLLTTEEERRSAEDHLRTRQQIAEAGVELPEDPEEGFFPICNECQESVEENLEELEQEAARAVAASQVSVNFVVAAGLVIGFVVVVWFSVFSK